MQPIAALEHVRLRHYPARSFEQLALKTGLGTLNQRLAKGADAIGGYHWQQTRDRVLKGDQSIEVLQFATRRYIDIERIDGEMLADTPIVNSPYPATTDLRYAQMGKPALSVLLNWIEGVSDEDDQTVSTSVGGTTSLGSETAPSGRSGEPAWKTHLAGGNDSFIEYYHDNPRGEIAELIRSAPRAYLDIGCAGGATAKLIKEKYPDCRCVGIELNKQAAALAARRMDKVISASIEDIELPNHDLPARAFDIIVMADVLEHLYNPWEVLLKIRPLLSEGGRVIASLPNVCNLQIFEQLAQGTWRYDKDGILDITHLRFFTPDDLRKMFEETGYDVELMKGIPHPQAILPSHQREGLFGIKTEHVHLRNLHPEVLRHLTSIQSIVVARLARTI